MPFYSLATRRLIDSLSIDSPDVQQIWYADDATAAGTLENLKIWWDHLSKIGPAFGYHVNLQKTWLVTSDNFSCPAAEIFGDSSVNITTDGRPVLGSPVGKPEYISQRSCHRRSNNGLVKSTSYQTLLMANLMLFMEQ